MNKNIEKMRQLLNEKYNRTENKPKFVTDKSVFPFWNAPEGGTTTIRFLPDADESNPFFWVERQLIKLTFQGVKGEHDREVTVQVPCMDMYNEACPITAFIRPWWKDEELKPVAQRYWKKKSYIFQGLIVNSDLQEQDAPENPIRRFIINPSIFEIIKTSLMDPDMEDYPTDFNAGVDFRLIKTSKGGFANYTTSKWARHPRALSEEELSAIDTYGLNDLKTFLPKKPTAEELEVIMEMFHASVNDEAYDPQRWSNYYRPAGLGNSGGSTPTASVPSFAAKPATKPQAPSYDDDEDYEESYTPSKSSMTSSSRSQTVDSILSKINSRKS